jgi:von Willebrand factor type A domain
MLRTASLLLALFASATFTSTSSAKLPEPIVFDQKDDLNTLKDTTKVSGLRIVAARQLANALGPKIADEFLDLGPKATTPPDLRVQLANLLADMKDAGVDKKIVAKLKDGNADDKIFHLRATKNIADAKLAKEICEKCVVFTGDKDGELRGVAVDVLVLREWIDAIPALEKMLKKEADFSTIGTAMAGITKLHQKNLKGMNDWEVKLKDFTVHENTFFRNAALRELGGLGKVEFLDLVAAQLKSKDWSTRVAALIALEKLRHKNAIPLIIAQMKSESGRPLEEFAATLERLTGAPLGQDVPRWEEWWRNKGAEFELAATAERPKTEGPGKKKAKYGDTTVEFLGLPITSRRIIFVVDISGSMQELARGILKNDTDVGGGTTTRMEVVKRELAACIDKLEAEALFNVIVFNENVYSWLNSGMAKMGKKTREDGKQYVMTREAAGGTNLYDAVRQAFQDADCDTIYILSDGQPTYGEQTDPATIRADIAKWNATRHIKIHTIAVGEQLDLLKAISSDAGGEHVEYK